MGRIKGHYEWDDDDLSPGHKKEGGLHQNLFDRQGKLKGSARFVPDDNDDAPLVITETVYVPMEQRRSQKDDEELVEAVANLLVMAHHGYRFGKPIAERWWKETGRPALEARKARREERRALRKAKKAPPGEVVEPAQELAAVDNEPRPQMSSAEAKARMLAGIAAKAFSDEQLKLVAEAEIDDGSDLPELKRSLAELPAEDLRRLVESMVKNPGLLREDSLADLASILGRQELTEELRLQPLPRAEPGSRPDGPS